jgi:DNA polymerase
MESISTWGGSLTENVVQAVARDVLVEGMLRAEEAGLPIMLHCHDEIGAEVDEKRKGCVETLEACMTAPIPWAEGLPLAAEGWEGKRYTKQ